MPIFAIQTPPDSDKGTQFAVAMARVFPGTHLLYAPGQYVGSKPRVTAEQIAKELGATGEIGLFVVFTTSGYFGWHRKNLWEWLEAQDWGA